MRGGFVMPQEGFTGTPWCLNLYPKSVSTHCGVVTEVWIEVCRNG